MHGTTSKNTLLCKKNYFCLSTLENGPMESKLKEKILSFLKNANFSNPLVQFIIRFIRSNKIFLALPSLLKLTSNKKPPCTKYVVLQCTEDGSTNAVLQILYGPYLILGVFGSYMF